MEIRYLVQSKQPYISDLGRVHTNRNEDFFGRNRKKWMHKRKKFRIYNSCMPILLLTRRELRSISPYCSCKEGTYYMVISFFKIKTNNSRETWRALSGWLNDHNISLNNLLLYVWRKVIPIVFTSSSPPERLIVLVCRKASLFWSHCVRDLPLSKFHPSNELNIAIWTNQFAIFIW